MVTDPSSDALQHVIAAARAVTDDPVVIAIDGRSGSGKTTLAAALLEVLPDAVVIHLDDLYPGWDGLAAGSQLVADVLRRLRVGAPASYRRFDWARGTFDDTIDIPRTRHVIVEGAGSSVGPARRYADVRVWLEADAETRKRRGLDRDGDAYAPHWQRWADQEDAVFGADRTRDHAHLTVRTDGP